MNIKQKTVLVILRVVIGWHFLYESITKLSNPNWSSVSYLSESKGFFSDLFISIATTPALLKIADQINIYGMMAVGLFLILGLFTRISILCGIAFLTLFYLSHPPLVGISYAMPTEGNYLWVNKNLIELFALVVLYYFPTRIGLDRLLFPSHTKNFAHE